MRQSILRRRLDLHGKDQIGSIIMISGVQVYRIAGTHRLSAGERLQCTEASVLRLSIIVD